MLGWIQAAMQQNTICVAKRSNNLIISLNYLGYCGIQYSAYSATNPDSFALDGTETIVASNVSCNLFLYHNP